MRDGFARSRPRVSRVGRLGLGHRHLEERSRRRSVRSGFHSPDSRDARFRATFYLGDDSGMAFAAIRDSSRATVLGNASGAPRPPPQAPFARSSGVLPLASFACRSAPFATRNSTKALK